MPGGLINIVAYGASNVILNGNPKKTFFKAVYKKYTNFGLQRFKLNFDGQRNLDWSADTKFEFKIKRYAELAWDTYLVVNMPDIWSPFYPRPDISLFPPTIDLSNVSYVPYEFKWIKNLGFQMIRKVTIHAGGNILAEYTGEYMQNILQRDEGGKRILSSEMIGNTPDMNDPANAFGRQNIYPNAAFGPSCNSRGIEPSIRGKKLYIPLLAWFCYSSKLALPLIALQYQDLFIRVEMRPIRELFTILNVQQPLNNIKYVCPQINGINSDGTGERHSPNSASATDQMWVFTQPPPDPSIFGQFGSEVQPITDLSYNGVYPQNYPLKNNQWNTDIHLISTYVFLGQEERRQFASSDHQYLVKEVHEYNFNNVTGSRRVDLPSRNMVSSYMFRFRRSDVNLRNEWSNYTNWMYENTLPSNLKGWGGGENEKTPHFLKPVSPLYGANPLNIPGYYVTGCRTQKNIKNILLELGVLMGGEYRENMHDAGVYNYIEKWLRTSGFAKSGLYFYNFCIDTHRSIYQPSGAQNTDKFKYVKLEFSTIQPPPNECFTAEQSVDVLCDPSGEIIGLRKDIWKLNSYNFDLCVWEERYNMVSIRSGRVGMLFAR
jgi:hypothetical protein